VKDINPFMTGQSHPCLVWYLFQWGSISGWKNIPSWTFHRSINRLQEEEQSLELQ